VTSEHKNVGRTAGTGPRSRQHVRGPTDGEPLTMQDDWRAVSASTPVVVFAHTPLWAIYPDRSWGTKGSEQAFSYLKPFGSVTVLNAHIPQVTQKAGRNAAFHTAMSSAFPQPAPGTAHSRGPLKVRQKHCEAYSVSRRSSMWRKARASRSLICRLRQPKAARSGFSAEICWGDRGASIDGR
jgi:hypothetical protein